MEPVTRPTVSAESISEPSTSSSIARDVPVLPPMPFQPEPHAPVPRPPTTPSAKSDHDVLLGVTGESPQYGVLGKVAGRTVSLDLNQTHTISLFGVQGGGKSYTLGTIIEMASLALPGINHLPRPLATVVFHYSQTQDFKPEFTSMDRPNNDPRAVETLAVEYGARPAALTDMIILVPPGKLEARCAEYPGIEVRPLKFASSADHRGKSRRSQ